MALPKVHHNHHRPATGRGGYLYLFRKACSAQSCKTNVINVMLLLFMAVGIIIAAHVYFFIQHVAIFDQLSATGGRKDSLRGINSLVNLRTATTNGEFVSLRTSNSFEPMISMPAVGYGTCCRKSSKGEAIYQSTKIYLEMGGRLIDTAMAYNNHKEIGRAIRDSGIDRSEIWITSKIAVGKVRDQDQTIEAVQQILQELGMTYLDLCLIHSPKLGKERTIEIWQGLIDATKTGLVRSIGVSNMNRQEIIELNLATGVLPAVNQIQYHPWTPQRWKDLVRWHAKNEIVTIAYTSLGGARFHKHSSSSRSSSSSSSFLSSPIISDLATKYHVTEAQLLLRWALTQPQVAVIPGATSMNHIVENLTIPYFRLEESDMVRLEEEETAPRGWWDDKRGPAKFPDEEAERAWSGDHLLQDHSTGITI